MQCEDYDDKLFQQLAKIDRFLPVKTQHLERWHRPQELPKLELPTLSGDSLISNMLFDSFNQAARTNSSFQYSEKPQYLNASVKCDAAKFFPSVIITDATNTIAIMMLPDQ